MKTGYSDEVNKILQHERDRPRDRLDAEIELMSLQTTVHTYSGDGGLEDVKTKTITESHVRQTKGIRKFLGVFSK